MCIYKSINLHIFRLLQGMITNCKTSLTFTLVFSLAKRQNQALQGGKCTSYSEITLIRTVDLFFPTHNKLLKPRKAQKE